VHGVGGILGTLLAGIFSSTQLGLFSGYGFAKGIDSISGQFWVQTIGVVSTIAFTAIVSWGLLKLVDRLVGLRVNEEAEIEGLDISQHEERGYDIH
jgi:Amt family ammonium transporter